ncbi:MAG: class I SAM-dependent methyltransferase [Candidatus Scalinduaceae bacterium]
MENENLAQSTHKIFSEIHKEQAEDKLIHERLVSLLTTEYLEVEENFFLGKRCLDAGCGSGNALDAMLRQGAECVTGIDFSNTLFGLIHKRLLMFKDKYKLETGNLMSLRFDNGQFDFVHCSGVLHHTENANIGFCELSRVTKTGGYLFVAINGSGGLVREISGLLRKKYKEDSHFKKYIDSMDSKRLDENIDWLSEQMEKGGDHLLKEEKALFWAKKLTDKDLLLTIRDQLQAPTYEEFSEIQIRSWFKKQGFVDVKRLSRYPQYNNIRRFLSPLYFNYKHELAVLLFGEGVIQMIGKKKGSFS